MWEVRQYENEYIIGRVNCYTNLFTCYDYFGTLEFQTVRADNQLKEVTYHEQRKF